MAKAYIFVLAAEIPMRRLFGDSEVRFFHALYFCKGKP